MAKILAQDPRKEYDFILPSQSKDKKEDQIIWRLRTLSAFEEDTIGDESYEIRDGQYKAKIATQNKLALDAGLVSVSNFFDSDGNEIKVDREDGFSIGNIKSLTPEFLDRIPKLIRQQLSKQILEANRIGVEEAKN